MGNTSGWTKNKFSELLSGRRVPYPLSQLWTWFQLGADFLRLVSGGNINMVVDFCGWSQALLNSLQLLLLYWWFYLLMLYSDLNYNNFHCDYNLALLVRFNKIYILIYWNECCINNLKQQDFYFDFLGWV